jgi:hypothetical protein
VRDWSLVSNKSNSAFHTRAQKRGINVALYSTVDAEVRLYLRRSFVLSAVIPVELLVAVVGVRVLVSRERCAIRGYMVKDGHGFGIGWRDRWDALNYKWFPSFDGAKTYAENELHLAGGRVTSDTFETESVWVQDRYGTYIVLWKTTHSRFLNQLTFNGKKEADYFASEFRRGAYTPSPFGHSVYLAAIR